MSTKTKVPHRRTQRTAMFETINVNNFNIPETIKYADVLQFANESFSEAHKFPELLQYDTLEKWTKRLQLGKLIDINDPSIGGIHNIEDGWTDIRECIGWKLVRIENNILNRLICPAIVVKRKNGKIYFLDGRTRSCLFHIFKVKNVKVYVLHLTDDEEDYIEKAKNEIKEMQPVFDYRTVNEDHKSLVRDIIKRIDTGTNLNTLKMDLSILFKLEKENEYDLSKSPFMEYAKKVQLFPTKQGHITVKTGDEKPTNYPVISMCDDVRKFDKIIEIIMQEMLIQLKSSLKDDK